MSGLIDPAEKAFVITPSDDDDLTEVTRGLYIGVSGDVKVEMVSEDIVTFVAMAAGVVHPLQVKRVYSTGTDATDIIGVF